MEELGQIRLGTPFGDRLHELCFKNPSIRTVVEIGTWKGLGSTECIIRGLADSNREGVSFISLEAESSMHAISCEAWGDRLPKWAEIMWGRIVDVEEMDDADLGSGHPDEQMWFEQDRNAFVRCPNVMGRMPPRIDFLFLDGGEFSTYAEYLKLKDRCMFVGMDDTTSRKCRRIRDNVLSNPDQYEVLLDNPWYRNGVMIYRNRSGAAGEMV